MLDVLFNFEIVDLCVKVWVLGEVEFFDLFVNYARVDLEVIFVEVICIVFSKKLYLVLIEVSGEKLFMIVVEELMIVEECACLEDEDAWGIDVRFAICFEILKFMNIFIIC